MTMSTAAGIAAFAGLAGGGLAGAYGARKLHGYADSGDKKALQLIGGAAIAGYATKAGLTASKLGYSSPARAGVAALGLGVAAVGTLAGLFMLGDALLEGV